MQLRISARQIHGVRVVGRRLVVERREEAQLATGPAPRIEHVRIAERERIVARHRNAPAEHRQAVPVHRRLDTRRPSRGQQSAGVDLPAGLRGRTREKALQVRVLARLHQAEMTVRQLQAFAAGDAAEDRNADGLHGPAQQLPVPCAAGAVEDDARDLQSGVEARESVNERGDRCRHARGVDHQHHRPAGAPRQVGGRTAAVRSAIEQAHHAFHHDGGRVALQVRDQRRHRAVRHAPGIEVVAGPTAGRGVVGGVDVVGPHLGGGDGDARVAQDSQQRKRQGGLAASRPGCRDDDSAAHGRNPGRATALPAEP